jgi:predicted transglutaminase-like cysteine proteinase
MKKTAVAAARVIAASLVLLTTTISIAQANTPLLDRTPSLTDLASQLQTPEKIAKYMWRHFLFEHDQRQFGKEEYWQTPEEFLATGKGDCEDFAIFAHELMKSLGMRSFILNVYAPNFSHTVAVFEENGQYHVIDEAKIVRYGASSLEELLTKINRHWKSGAIVIPSQTSKTGLEVRTITR